LNWFFDCSWTIDVNYDSGFRFPIMYPLRVPVLEVPPTSRWTRTAFKARRYCLVFLGLSRPTIGAEQHESFCGGFIPSPNHHGGYRRNVIDLVIGFFAGNGDGGEPLCQSFRIEMPVG
jgi:hypothetical protein